MADLERLTEIENALHRDYNLVTDRRYASKIVLNDNSRLLLRDWLRALDVSERKVITMRDDGLQNAYFAGRNWVTNRIVNEDVNRRFGNPRRNVRDVEIDLDVNDLLDQKIGETEEVEPLNLINPADFQSPTPAPTPRQVQIDERAIIRAAEATILPRLRTALTDLTNQVNQVVDNKLHDELVKLGEETRAKIVEIANEEATKIATETAWKVISENTPRRIEIRQNGKILRELPAEPRHEAFDRIFKQLSRGHHVYIVGPAGTGKTHMFKQLAEALGYDIDTEFFPIDQSLTKFDVKGYNTPTGEYIDTLVRRAVQNGGFMAIDEGDMWAAPALGSLNSILANDYGPFPDGTVKVHPRFRCVLAANTFGHGATLQYQGRNPLDAASLDRFAYIRVGYDNRLECQIYGNGPWVQYVQRVRKAVEDLKITHVVSMRATARGLKDLADGDSPEDVCFSQLWRSLDQTQIAKIKNVAGEFTVGENIEEIGGVV